MDLLGTGTILLNSWRYYNESSKCSLTWGLDIYEEEGYIVDDVTMEFTRLTSTDTFETVNYQINKKSSYNGVFYDLLPLNQDYYRLSNQLHPNELYLVKINVSYVPEEMPTRTIINETPRVFYRWLYTNTIFNKDYATESDFSNLSLDFTPSLSMSYNTTQSVKAENTIYGIINIETKDLTEEEKLTYKDSLTSLSGIQTEKEVNVNCNLLIGLENNYNTFNLHATNDSFNIKLEKTKLEDETEVTRIECSDSSTIKYTDREDSNQDIYLNSESEIVYNNTDYNNYKLTNSTGVDKSDEILETPTNVIKLNSNNITPSFSDNIYTFDVKYDNLQLVKAYCSKTESTSYYQGRVVPLAYDDDTFAQYNLEFISNQWRPTIVGLYGFGETGGKKGYSYIGRHSNDGSGSDQVVEEANDVSFHWTTDARVANA